MQLTRALDLLETAYGSPPPAVTTDPWEMALWENVAYLADDPRRSRAFADLKTVVGADPEQILAAPHATIRQIVAGMLPDQRVARLRRCAEIAMDELGGETSAIGSMPPSEAFTLLRKFPGIGGPCA